MDKERERAPEERSTNQMCQAATRPLPELSLIATYSVFLKGFLALVQVTQPP